MRLPTAARGPVGAQLETGTTSPAAASSARTETTALPSGNVLGAEFGKSRSAFGSKSAFLLAAALVAAMFLGLASLPATVIANPRLGAFVERRRTELALAGSMTLLLAILAYLATGS